MNKSDPEWQAGPARASLGKSAEVVRRHPGLRTASALAPDIAA